MKEAFPEIGRAMEFLEHAADGAEGTAATAVSMARAELYDFLDRMAKGAASEQLKRVLDEVADG